MDKLPTVLLGLRTALRKDNFSPAIMTYGTTLQIPADFFVPTQPKINDTEYVRRLTETMATLQPAPRKHTAQQKPFIYKDLTTCTHMFVRNDMVRAPLTTPYDGPYKF